MTTEEKQLLTRVLLGMSPYGLIVKTEEEIEKPFVARLHSVDVYREKATLGLYKNNDLIVRLDSDISKIKPYLRPMESMTEKEKEVYEYLCSTDEECRQPFDSYHLVDWLNRHCFDYRGLIPMGLALPALEGMYN